jgi:primosomal protein N' (replication factor Y)
VTLNAALGPLDYRVPEGMAVEPGTVVVAPLGPRQLIGVAWEADRLKTEEVGDNRLRPLAGLVDVPPIAAPLRRLAEWTADYYLSPLAAVLRMIMPSSAALAGPRTMIEYRPTGVPPLRLTPQRDQALSRIEGRQGTVRELAAHADVSEAVMRGLVHAGALERIEVDGDQPFPLPDPDFAAPTLSEEQRHSADSLKQAIGNGFDPVLLDGVTGSGKTEVYFEAIAEAVPARKAGARPAARDCPYRAISDPLHRSLRQRTRDLAQRPSFIAAPPRLACDFQGRSKCRGRRPVVAISPLCQPRTDRGR